MLTPTWPPWPGRNCSTGSTCRRSRWLTRTGGAGSFEGRPPVELWAEIEQTPGYWLSNMGRVCSPSGRLIQGAHHGTGYHVVSLPDGRSWRRLFIHRLVLNTFMGPCPEGHQAAHWNGDRADNRLANLRWATAAENAADRERHG